MRPATPIELSAEERRTLESWVRASTTEQRLVLRAQLLILAAAGGATTTAIARRWRVRPGTVSQWRRRFAAQRLVGLQDRPRPGPRRRYGVEVEGRILKLLDQAPPSGYASWSGGLLAQALGDVSARQVWRVLARHRISLQRRHSWCISTDPQFAAKAADLVGGFISPRPIRRWCWLWMRSLRFRYWSVLRVTCGFPMIRPSKALAPSTSA